MTAGSQGIMKKMEKSSAYLGREQAGIFQSPASQLNLAAAKENVDQKQLSLFQGGGLQTAGDSGGGQEEQAKRSLREDKESDFLQKSMQQTNPCSLASLASIEVTLRYGRKWLEDCTSQSTPAHMVPLLMPRGLLLCLGSCSFSGKPHPYGPCLQFFYVLFCTMPCPRTN